MSTPVRHAISHGVRVGVSGWTYPPWRGNFFPRGLPQRLEFEFATRRFNAVEVNGTFYSLQRPETFQGWYRRSPAGFVFALKGGRFITHMRRLRDVRTPLANFFASGPLALREKLGPILWQLPPQLRFDEGRLRTFFELLPKDTLEAARLARLHDSRRGSTGFVDADALRPVRHAVEFRHESFLDERFVGMLREFGIALVVADVAGKFPTAEDVTADWVYVRLHGSRVLYSSGYTPGEIESWAGKVRSWRAGSEPARARRISAASAPPGSPRDVYVFFDNTDAKLRAPRDAASLAHRLGVAVTSTPSSVARSLRSALAPDSGSVRRASARRRGSARSAGT